MKHKTWLNKIQILRFGQSLEQNTERISRRVLHKPFAIQKAIAIILCNVKALHGYDQSSMAKGWFLHGFANDQASGKCDKRYLNWVLRSTAP